MTSILNAAGSFNAARALAWLLVAALVGLVFALVVVPWQQSVSGAGRVIAYAPLERQQTIEAPNDGRVVRWHVQEGDHVEEGDLLAELSDIDVNVVTRLERERAAAQAELEAATLAIITKEAQVASLEAMSGAATVGVDLRRQMANDRAEAAAQAEEAAQARLVTAELNVDRQRALHEKGLASTRTLELSRLEHETATAELARAKASLRAAKRESKALAADVGRTDADNESKIQSAKASLQSSRAAKAKAEGDLARVEVRLARQRTLQVVAPRGGTVFRLEVQAGGEMVKAGDRMVVLVPDVLSHAVEVWIDGNDAPLVTPGRHVRLQFEGWPAVQFVGWPSVAVGTFGGQVAFVDATDDGYGRFRVVVIPDGTDEWPEARYLRQGVRTNGWILLNQVSLGYELWRQLNGFPPVVAKPGDGGQGAAGKGAGK